MERSDFNRFCGSLPATSHVIQWHKSDVWKVGDKVFAIGGWNPGEVVGITFKTTEIGYEILRGMPGLRPAPYFASRGMKWIQRYDVGFGDDDLRHCIAESHHIVALGLSRSKRIELGLCDQPYRP